MKLNRKETATLIESAMHMIKYYTKKSNSSGELKDKMIDFIGNTTVKLVNGDLKLSRVYWLAIHRWLNRAIEDNVVSDRETAINVLIKICDEKIFKI